MFLRPTFSLYPMQCYGRSRRMWSQGYSSSTTLVNFVVNCEPQGCHW